MFGFLPWPPPSPRRLGTPRHHHTPPRSQLLSRAQRDQAVQLLSLPAQSHAWLHLPRQAYHHVDHRVGWEAGPPASPNRACSPHLSSAAASRRVSASKNTARRRRPRTRPPTTRPRASTAARTRPSRSRFPPRSSQPLLERQGFGFAWRHAAGGKEEGDAGTGSMGLTGAGVGGSDTLFYGGKDTWLALGHAGSQSTALVSLEGRLLFTCMRRLAARALSRAGLAARRPSRRPSPHHPSSWGSTASSQACP